MPTTELHTVKYRETEKKNSSHPRVVFVTVLPRTNRWPGQTCVPWLKVVSSYGPNPNAEPATPPTSRSWCWWRWWRWRSSADGGARNRSGLKARGLGNTAGSQCGRTCEMPTYAPGAATRAMGQFFVFVSQRDIGKIKHFEDLALGTSVVFLKILIETRVYVPQGTK